MHKQILRLAIPNIISNITVPLLGAVDLAMMGRLDNLHFMGAIALGAMIFNFMYWALGFLRMGTCGFTAQAYGARNESEYVQILGRGLLIACIGAIVLWFCQSPILESALYLTDASNEIAETTRSYFNIRIWGAPAAITSFVFAGWFIGMQNTKIPMWIAIFINICNVGFNYVFVFRYGMTSDGVALGTVLAQYAGLALTLIILFTKYRKQIAYFSWQKIMQLKALKRFLNINADIFLRTLLIIAVFSFFTGISARMGSEILVLNTLLYQFFIFFSYGMDGFAHAGEALVGKYIGAGQRISLKHCIRAIFLWGLGLSFLTFIIYGIGYDSLLRVFTSDAQIHLLAKDYYYWILALPLLSFAAFLFDGVYAGALATRAMLYIMLVAVAFFFPTYYFLLPYWGNHALWFALLLFLMVRGLGMWLFLSTLIFKKNKI